MPGEKRLIISLNPAGWLTLSGLALDLAAVFLLVDLPGLPTGGSFSAAPGRESYFFLAIGLMYLGMLADAFDGIIARKFKWETEFGRYLDGFVDVFNYLVIPNLALWKLGFRGPAAGAIITLMIAAGVLRLSKFNMIGNITHEGSRKYLGLPVFWSQLLFCPLYLLFAFLPEPWFFPACAATWMVMSWAFILNRPFFKPRNPFVIAGLTLALSAAGFILFALGKHP